MESRLTLVCVLLLSGCASLGGQRHAGVSELRVQHERLKALDDFERSVVCGVQSAPPPPACVTKELDRQLGVLFVEGYDAHLGAAKALRGTGAGTAVPSAFGANLERLRAIVEQVMGKIPSSAQKAAFVAALEAR